MTRTAAFFDLDGTLLSVNSGQLWARQQWREGRLNLWQMGQAIFYMSAYTLGAIDMTRAMRAGLKTVVDRPEQEVRRWTERWYQQEVRPLAAPGAFAAVEDHRRRGHRLVLLTSSSPYEAEAARRHFALDDALSTIYETRQGRFTGELVLPLCFAEGKVIFAERYASRHQIDLETSFFYTDSITDLPMLERVGHPRVVQPDPRLKREAGRRRWQVLDWSRR